MSMFHSRLNAGLEFKKIMNDVNLEAERKFDMTVGVNTLRMGLNGNMFATSRLNEPGYLGSPMTDHAFSQVCASLDIPVKFARRVPNDLRAQNVNYFLEKAQSEQEWLLRSYTQADKPEQGPLLRGVLSSGYTKFDDDMFLEMVGKCIGSSADHKVLMWYRDEKGMHLRIGMPDLTAAVGRLKDGNPDTHMVGFHVSNSEVGGRAVTIQPMVFRLVCKNGLMRWESDGDVFRQRHIYLNEREMYGRVAEGIVSAISGGDKMVEELKQVKEIEVPDPMATIRKLAESRKYTKKLTDNIEKAFDEEPGETQFHVLQAFTRAARDLEGDERVELERDASRLLKAQKGAVEEIAYETVG
ncbi:hypothetical protein A8L34_28095 [Bacillus sp. FJAT-27264]|uniref:DUF932 domain-containing protein n=1 Tax=Paenibacillus sp. (strain DSM 101736 / FJAT-27264) TaxID=1850362 RepID=UPI0008081312|nr:DUF932 domain-containing protein [Bacillus sp. FJAT-27264]OBZ15911.1 hypothetical protein A8L34_28095 [Bacillus sp. FJAT-27264]